jgi:hypothetical protein
VTVSFSRRTLLHGVREMRNTYLKGRNYLEDLGMDGKIKLKWIIGKYGGKVWTGFIWLRVGSSGRLL